MREADRAEWLMKEHLFQARDFLIDRLEQEPGAEPEFGSVDVAAKR